MFFFHSNIWLKNHTTGAATQNFLLIYWDDSKNIRHWVGKVSVLLGDISNH
jgi:hypothetical protein